MSRKTKCCITLLLLFVLGIVVLIYVYSIRRFVFGDIEKGSDYEDAKKSRRRKNGSIYYWYLTMGALCLAVIGILFAIVAIWIYEKKKKPTLTATNQLPSSVQHSQSESPKEVQPLLVNDAYYKVTIKPVLSPDWDFIPLSGPDTLAVIKEVDTLFNDTWQYNERHGRDSANLKHNSLEIKAICIVHKKQLIDIYRYETASFKEKHSFYPPIEIVSGTKKVLTLDSNLASCLEAVDNSLPNNCVDLNEVYLFHGTKTDNIRGIVESGFSLKYATNGLYGRALYLAESSEKSDQYSDKSSIRQTKNLCMVISRTILGRTYVHQSMQNNMKLSSLPCTKRNCFTPGCSFHNEKFNSALAGLDKRFREFLVYNVHQCYPNVLVFYDRVETKYPINQQQNSPPCYLIGPKNEMITFKNVISNKNNDACNILETSAIIDETNTHENSPRDIQVDNIWKQVMNIPCSSLKCRCNDNDTYLINTAGQIRSLGVSLKLLTSNLTRVKSGFLGKSNTNRPLVNIHCNMLETDIAEVEKHFSEKIKDFEDHYNKRINLHKFCSV